MSKKLLFIGGGNMTQAIVGGLIDNGYSANSIFVVDRNSEKCQLLQQQYQVHVNEKITVFLDEVDTVILAIKPQAAEAVCATLRPQLRERKLLIISIMAGLNLASLAKGLGEHLAIIRAMPNTPALVQEGATGFFGNVHVSEAELLEAENIFSAIGIAAKLKSESDLDTVTALSGSGPAYYFYFMASMQDAAIQMGLDPETAKSFAIQTAYGAAKLARDSDVSVAELGRRVTSKKGTTEAALNTLQAKNLDEILASAMQAAVSRARELAKLNSL